MRIDGGCHCGKISYQAEADPVLGTVRQRGQLAPKSQFWCGSALPWSLNLGALQQHPKQPG